MPIPYIPGAQHPSEVAYLLGHSAGVIERAEMDYYGPVIVSRNRIKRQLRRIKNSRKIAGTWMHREILKGELQTYLGWHREAWAEERK